MNIYLDIFTCFAKIGAFTIGGGYAMIPIIQKEVVDKRGWISEDDFMDVLAISQSAPGILAVNISIFLGHKLKGTKGSIVATLGSTLPSFNFYTGSLAALTALLIIFLKVSPLYILLVVAVTFTALTMWRRQK